MSDLKLSAEKYQEIISEVLSACGIEMYKRGESVKLSPIHLREIVDSALSQPTILRKPTIITPDEREMLKNATCFANDGTERDWSHVEPEFDAMNQDQERLAIEFCEEIAGKKGDKPSLPDPVRLLEMAQDLYAAEKSCINPQQPKCSCDGSGLVHSPDGQFLGACDEHHVPQPSTDIDDQVMIAAKEISLKVAKNASVAPQLCFPDIYLGLKELYSVDRYTDMAAKYRNGSPLYAAPPDYEVLRAENERLRADIDRLKKRFAYECWSNDDGDCWSDDPANCEFVDGLKVGDTFEVLAGWNSVRVNYIVTKVPDDVSEDYEVEEYK